MKISVNKRYEIEFRTCEEDESYEFFERLLSIVLLDKNKIGDKVILRADNSHKNAIHIHQPNSKGRDWFLSLGSYTKEKSWEDFRVSFLDKAIKIIGEANRQELITALNKIC